jgi:flagellar export protein FliJ
MKKFKYRLESLRRLAEHEERARQKELATAVKQVERQRASLDEIGDRRQATLLSQHERLTGRLSLAELLVFSRYLVRLKKDAVIGHELLRALTRTERKKRERLLQAARERQKHDKLKERRREQYIAEAQRLEAGETDEVSLQIHRRKSN